ncbi:unnamed protein product [Closterium sp. Yama58-4]|nr:unnamed protein product [Closterium sp. Yama58-4]
MRRPRRMTRRLSNSDAEEEDSDGSGAGRSGKAARKSSISHILTPDGKAFRPHRIILVRHGQSEGNVDEAAYTRIPDSKIALTRKGWEQAVERGRKLRELIEADGEEDFKVYFYVSPYTRTLQTLRGVGLAFERERIAGVREEPRIREQDFGNFQDREKMRREKKVRLSYGRFFYRFPDGESAADVYDRVTGFRETLRADIDVGRFQREEAAARNMNLVLVSHGLTLRVFLMRWYKWTVEQFEGLYNFPNAGCMIMQLGPGGRYSLRMHHSREELRAFGMTESMIDDQEWQITAKPGDLNPGWLTSGAGFFDHFDENEECGIQRDYILPPGLALPAALVPLLIPAPAMASTAFPSLSSTVAPPPSALWSANLSAPYPTNAPWQNFVLGQGGSPELVSPYVVQSGDGRVAWGIPVRNAQPAYIIQAFITNLMLSTLQGLPPHQVSAYDDLSVTLSFRQPSAGPSAPPALVVPLVRGSPYLTFIFPQGGPPATPVLKTIHAILSVQAIGDSKYRVALNNGQTWLVYLSSPLALRQDGSSIVAAAPFTGTMRIALLPGNSPQREEALLDAHVATVPVGGRARVGAFRIKLSWRTQQWRKLAPGDSKTPLLMLSLPVHRRLRVFAHNPTPATALRRQRSVSPSDDGTAAIRVSAPAGLSSTRADGGWGATGWDSDSSSSGSSSDGQTESFPTAQGSAASTAVSSASDPTASNQAAMAWTSASSSASGAPQQETVLWYPTIDGRAVGVKGAVWDLKVPKTPTTWHSPSLSSDPQLTDALRASLKQDVAALPPLTTASTYFFGKAAARAARLALIAEQVHDDGSLAAVLPPLRDALTAWLNGTFHGNRLLYDPTWGGVISEAGSRDKGADFGLGMYNDHHFHYGYFVYAAATVAKFDPMWGNQYRAQLAALVADYMSVNRTAAFPRLRHFDAYALHSWASGLFDFADGRNQESFSEAANAYYAASLLAFTFGDLPLATLGATLAAVEAVAGQTLMQVPVAGSSASPAPSLSPAYEPVFADANRMLGMVWSTKRDAGLWFATPAELDKRVGIQVLPITPFLAHLFPDRAYARQLVEWAQPVLSGSGVTDEWRGFAWALQALYDPQGARSRIGALGAFDDGNSKTNMLWWLASNTP